MQDLAGKAAFITGRGSGVALWTLRQTRGLRLRKSSAVPASRRRRQKL